MSEFSNNQNREKIISLIFQIERSIKRAENEAGLEYVIANQIKPLISYKLLAIWRSSDHRKERVSALSGVDSFDENHPNYDFFQSFGKFFYENQKKILSINYQELNNELQIMGGEFKGSFFLWAPLTCLPLNAGGLIFLKESPWQEVEINLVKMIVESCAFGLWAWRRNNQQFQFVNRLISQPKKVAIVTLIVLVIGFIPIKMSVISPAEVVAQDANLISSPIDGVISKIHVQPNSEVSEGDLLISLDKSIFQAQKDISIDIFIDGDQQALKSKIGGSINQQVPNDSERHNIQKSKLDTNGISSEPIIVYLTKDGKYDLVEGWHRTTASLKKYGRYKQNAWVYINF
jgi:hypothetical protein